MSFYKTLFFKLTFCFLLISQVVFSQHALHQLIPTNTATHTAKQSGSWSSVTTWEEATIPSDGAIVVIPAGITVTFEEVSTAAHIFAIRVDGTFRAIQSNSTDTTKLIFDTFIGTSTSKIEFHANNLTDGYIDVGIKPFDIEAHKAGTSGFTQSWNAAAINHYSDGDTTYQYTYDVGPNSRFKNFEDAQNDNTTLTATFQEKLLDGAGILGRYSWDSTQLSIGLTTIGEIEIIGQEKSVMAKLSADAANNQAVIEMETVPHGWKVGDEILVTRGGNIGEAAAGTETAIISSINGNTITTANNLSKNHSGRPNDNLHCYVGNLDRNITFRSLNKDDISHRGHLMVMHNPSNIQIKNAAFIDMGRTDKSKLLDDLIWSNWVEPVVHQSYVSALGQECSQLVNNAKDRITNHRGRYSIHLHQTGAVNGTNLAQVTGNVIRGNPGWGITHHDAHANVSDNVIYDVTGAGIVSEFGNETGFWDNNLVVDIKQGHNFDFYKANLFYGDYLFSGQGFGMKGRGVICRNNVIVEANRGVGVLNLSSTINVTKRMDSEALASFRPDFMFDQFPLDKNGYSKEGDGIIPTEIPLIMENTTTIWCTQGINSIERDPGVNHESRSIFNGFKAWGSSIGFRINYQADYSFRDVFISGKNSNSQGIIMYKHAHNMVYDQIKFADLEYAIVTSKLHNAGSTNVRTRNTGFSPWLFIDLEMENVDHLYYVTYQDASDIPYTEHPDNAILLSSTQLSNSRPITFTLNDAADLAIDLAAGDLQFRVDGAITDKGGTYEFGITQATSMKPLRVDYDERIYEFASQEKLEAFLVANEVYKDTANNDQLYFIINEYVPDRFTYEYKPFPIRVKILNAPNTAPYNNPKIEDRANFATQLQLISRFATARQSSLGTTAFQDSTNISGYAAKAIDGNNNGRPNVNYYQLGLEAVGSAAITQTEQEPWWEMDLGDAKIIEYIDIWNTVEMQGQEQELSSPHFKNFYVLVSDTPFENANLAEARAIATHEYYNPTVKRLFSLNQLNITGRYIRIQAEGMTKIGIAEVDVLGRDANPMDCNGVVNGLAYVDNCGTCVAGNTGNSPCILDCHNVWGGTAVIDNCGNCVGGNTGLVTATEIPCNGIDDDCNPATLDAPAAQDDDGDGICNPLDKCANGPEVGMSCDDGNPCTINDAIDAFCNCVGEIPTTLTTTNIALGKTVSQSSIKDGAGPELAIDGNTDGILANGSVTYTNRDQNAWWEIDLGASNLINQINIHNRSDCCKNRLSDFYILLSETPFVSTTLSEVLTQSGVTSLPITEAPNLSINIPLNHNVRYVRIQLNANQFLSLTEVEILSINQTTLYRDADGDGFGDANNAMANTACGAAPGGYVLDNTDFNDAVATAYPNATEICDEIDNNNNGNIDEIITDEDDDGINDCQDNCPDTPVGERAGINGCSCSQLTIDDGDFCTTDICKDGVVTHQDMTFEQETILLQNTNPTDPIYTASQTITTDQDVIIKNNKQVRFYAGNGTTLHPGFSVEPGAFFEAKIVLECIDDSNNLNTETATLNDVNLSQNTIPAQSEVTMSVAPNPFSNQTTIQLDLPTGTLASLQVYNLNGQLVADIIEKEWLPKGANEFIYTPVNPLSGMYYMVLKTNDTVKTTPIIMVD